MKKQEKGNVHKVMHWEVSLLQNGLKYSAKNNKVDKFIHILWDAFKSLTFLHESPEQISLHHPLILQALRFQLSLLC